MESRDMASWRDMARRLFSLHPVDMKCQSTKEANQGMLDAARAADRATVEFGDAVDEQRAMLARFEDLTELVRVPPRDQRH